MPVRDVAVRYESAAPVKGAGPSMWHSGVGGGSGGSSGGGGDGDGGGGEGGGGSGGGGEGEMHRQSFKQFARAQSVWQDADSEPRLGVAIERAPQTESAAHTAQELSLSVPQFDGTYVFAAVAHVSGDDEGATGGSDGRGSKGGGAFGGGNSGGGRGGGEGGARGSGGDRGGGGEAEGNGWAVALLPVAPQRRTTPLEGAVVSTMKRRDALILLRPAALVASSSAQ